VKSCPDCLSEIPDGAAVCRHCGERVEGKRCPECGTRCWPEARRCRWCGHRFEKEEVGVVELEPFEVTADRLATLVQRGRFRPQCLTLTPEKVVVHTPGLFNLSRREEEIPWAKVAGFDYHSGIFWDQITIETRGQRSTSVGCLAKADGARIRAVLRRLER